MQCSSCGSENREGRKFCAGCGAALTLACTACGANNQPGERFCGECGRQLAEAAKESPQRDPRSYTPKHLAEKILTSRAALEGERKTITALFADIKGSVELMEDLDPEDANHIIEPALRLMIDAVHRYEGFVAQSTGDGIFALFGAPIAHEDHAQRALYAALRMQEEIGRYSEKLKVEKGVPLEIRVGVNTGEVVLRSIRKDDLHVDYTPIGHSTNLAARLESLAIPGTIVVSDTTKDLTEGYFQFRSLGKAKVKGVSEPVALEQVLGLGPLRTKLEVSTQRGLTRFVGRQAEMAQLQRALSLARSGRGQIVGVMGEPGVGKSRLLHEFKLASQNVCRVLEAFAVSHGRAYPYLPLIDLLKSYFGIKLEDDERRRQEEIARKLEPLDPALGDTLPYIFALLGILEAESPLHQMDSQIRRSRTFEALKRLFLRETKDRPLLLIVEDLHWLDAETEAFLIALGESIATARFLLLVNYRPEYREPWTNKTYVSQIRLDPLEAESAEEMLTALLGDETELQPLKRLVLEKSEGTPFFIEEIVRALFERGVLVRNGTVKLTRPLGEIRLPATVEALLAARLDRLAPEEKELLQAASVIGREFPLAVLGTVVGDEGERLRALLSRLQSAEFVYEQPLSAETQYIFKHALTRDVAYNSLLLERRSALHECAAQAIERIYENRLDEHYGELAHHYSHSGNTKKAVEYLQLAGEQAAQRSAHSEAATHLTAALELLSSLPPSIERTQQELTLRIVLGTALVATKGYAAPEVERAYSRARKLCQLVGETPQLFRVLRGLWVFYLVRAQLQTARELGEQLLSLAQGPQDSALLVEAHRPLGTTLFHLGELPSAREHLKQGIVLYNRQQHRSHAFLYGQDPGVISRIYAALALWFLGSPDQALKGIHEALTQGRKLSHPFSLAWALFFTAVVHQLRQEGQRVREQAEAVITLCTERGFPYWLAKGTVLHGWALAEQEQGEEGIAQIRQGLAAHRATGSELWRSYYLALLAESYGRMGQTADGLTVLAEALAFVDKTGERFYEAELHRLKGELTLQQFKVQSSTFNVTDPQSLTPNPQTQAEACFHKAIDIARRQQAKSLELRATMSLARLWQQQDKAQEAHHMLAEVYGWFTEGFDTMDLREARALLKELA